MMQIYCCTTKMFNFSLRQVVFVWLLTEQKDFQVFKVVKNFGAQL